MLKQINYYELNYYSSILSEHVIILLIAVCHMAALIYAFQWFVVSIIIF